MIRKTSASSGTLSVVILVVAVFTFVLCFAAQAQQVNSPPPGIRRSADPATSLGFTFLPAESFDSGGQLAWTLAVADLNGDGKPDVAVVNYGSNGPDGTIGVLLGRGNGSFGRVVAYDTGGGGATGIAIGDLNGDGKPDMVVVSQSCQNRTTDCVGVLLGNGDGTFQPVVTYPRGGGSCACPGVPTPIMIADINGDGKPDLVVVNFVDFNLGDGVVGVLLGNGDGTFQPVVPYDTGGAGAMSGFLRDVNGDGKLDLVVLNCSPRGSSDCSHNGTIGVLLGNGNGTFQPVTTYDSGGLGGTPALVVADVNSDGKPDILVGNYCPGNCTGPGSFGVLLGKGDGTFQKVVTYTLTGVAGVEAIAVADLNGDGKPDLTVVGNGIDVWLGKGDGTFQFLNSYATTGNTNQVLLTDLDGDGKLDFVDINVTSGTADARLGNGDGTFQSAQTFTLSSKQYGPISWGIIADVNGDGRPDLVSANWTNSNSNEGQVGVLLNVASNPNTTSTALTSSLNPSIYGQKVTFTATVASSNGPMPTGSVSFTWGGIYTIGTATLNASGVATLVKSSLNADSYPLTAVYKGDSDNLGSTSSIVNQVVQQTTSAATLTSSPNPSTVGQAVTFTAKIKSPTVIPTGQVTFKAGTTVLGTVQLSGGKATFTISSLPAGSTVVKVTYNGDSNIKGSSASETQVVQP